MIVLAHDALALVWIAASFLTPPLLLAAVRAPVWTVVVATPLTVVLLALPLSGLWRRVPRSAADRWPLDVHGRPVGRLLDAAGLNQTKGQAVLTGAPDLAPRRVRVIGRNARCPCGSGRKFKYCCGVRGWRHVMSKLRRLLSNSSV